MANMLHYFVVLFCILWFMSVWIRVLRCPFRLCSHLLLFLLKAVKTCYAKASDITKYARVQREETTEDANHLK